MTNNIMDFLNVVEDLFRDFKMHERYIMREKIYKGGGKYGTGLAILHKQYTEIQAKLLTISAEKINYHKPMLEKSVNKIKETLYLLYNFENISSDVNTVLKFIDVAKIEIDELEATILLMEDFDTSTIKSQEELHDDQVSDLKLKVQDNLNQITKSFEWKMQEAKLNNTIEGREFIENINNMISDCITNTIKINDNQLLAILALLAAKIRQETATYFDSLNLNLPLIYSFTKIGIMLENKQDIKISSSSIRNDIEHFLNVNGLSWLASMHEYIVNNDYRDKTLWKFAKKLNDIARSPTDAFLMTMTVIGNANANEELLKLSEDYATLLSTLLSISSKLEQRDEKDKVEKIQTLSQINPRDAIDDLTELYHPNKIKPQHFINALKKRIKDIQEVALDIILDEELAEIFLMMVQFTDFDSHVESVAELPEYILNKGRPNT